MCERIKKKLNADLKAASNTAHRAGYKVTIKKVESYRVTHSGVKPTTPLRRGQAETPAYRGSSTQDLPYIRLHSTTYLGI